MKYISVALYLSLIGVSLIFPSSASPTLPRSAQEISSPCSLHNLPTEIKDDIFLLCDVATINTLKRIDKTTHAHLTDDEFWRRKLSFHFDLQGASLLCLKQKEFGRIFDLNLASEETHTLLRLNPQTTDSLDTVFPPNIHKELYMRLELMDRLRQTISWRDIQRGEFTSHYGDLETLFNQGIPHSFANHIGKYKFISEPFACERERSIQISEFGLDWITMATLYEQIRGENLDPFYSSIEGILTYIHEKNISLPNQGHCYRLITAEDVVNLKIHYDSVNAFRLFYQSYMKVRDGYPERAHHALTKAKIFLDQQETQVKKARRVTRIVRKVANLFRKRTPH